MRVRFSYAGQRINEGVLRRALADAAEEDLDARANRVAARARQLVGVDTTRLIRSIRVERGAGYRDIVAGYNGRTPYASVHHDGSEPHIIRPRRAKALRFVIAGRTVYATRVRHPGTRPTRFMVRALAAAG